MVSIFSLLKKLVQLLQSTVNPSLQQGMTGLELAAILPTKADHLPTIVVSVEKVEKSICGLGSLVVIKKENTENGTRVVKRDRINGQMIFHIWIQKDKSNILKKIERAAELLIDLLETHQHELRVNGLLKNKLVSIGPVESSEDLSVWLISGAKGVALGRQLVYNFVYEDMEGEAEDERIIEKIVVEPIKVDGNVVPENASVPADG